MHAYTALAIFGLAFPVVFIIIPLIIESILMNKEK